MRRRGRMMAVKIRFDLPGCEVYEGAVAMPSKAIPRTGPQEMQGGIFTSDGDFIASSGLFRGVKSPIMAYGRCEPESAEDFDGNAVYGGFLYRGHYGHFLIESMTRMWRMLNHLEFDKIFFHAHPGHSAPCKIGEYLFKKMGIPLEKIAIITRPLRFSRITIPDPSLRLGGEEAFLSHRNVCATIAENVSGNYFDRPEENARPIYFSRTKFRVRPVFGEDELEAQLRENGWEIVYPESMSIEDQIKISRKSKVYCGVIGSAMHNLIFSRPGTKVFYIEREPSQKSTYNTLEALDKVIGLDPYYIPANVKSHTMAGPFLINPEIVLDRLREAGLVSKIVKIDMCSVDSKYEDHVKNIQSKK
ncbi:DUF563 domain-containing protein [Pseudomonas sp. NY5710]|nr:DUF563 domain-containing protein [Pseudomonas sp. NY5710]